MTELLEFKGTQVETRRPKEMGWYIRLGLIASTSFVGASVAWGTMAPLEGAVIAYGTVVVENSVNKVQHQIGGVVGAILVKEGQRVAAGEVVMRLDETATRAARQIVLNDLNTQRVRQARLNAEREQAATMAVPADLKAMAAVDPEIKQALISETALFEARARTRVGQRAQFSEQIKQSQQEIRGTDAQYKSAVEQVRVAELELADMRGLLAKNLVAKPRVTQLEREVARIRGTMGELTARAAQINARISETELQILQIDRALETEVAKDSREAEAKVAELNEKLATADDQLKRIDLRSPSDGIVHQMQIHTVGGVIAPGAAIMSIVPERDTLVIEAKVNPADIDQIHADQPARVRFSAFNSRTTPELNGSIFRIGADIARDERTGAMYYLVGVRVSDKERERLGKLKLIPGMPAEAFIKTSERTVASFLMKPLLEQLNRAFREE
ncbi:HlyD family type I secretion periplasmic adaptor subunit [Bosea beijingensis]|uniref:HlyD family type I secretion periplasmic adaptor subunit n=1 Tax=Bosea beijingensis TaxID=3068632 RepID=UPI002741FEEB|nr:HlyD family type I secretion periplasmic adaptor subunit [Bosea sp. REN20]